MIKQEVVEEPEVWTRVSEEEIMETIIWPKKSERVLRLGACLCPNVRNELIQLLSENKDCFTWMHEDMIGVDPTVIMHSLTVDPLFTPIQQKRRKFTPEMDKINFKEVKKLVDAGIVREIWYRE